MKEFLVQCRETCPTCFGCGTVYSDVWKEYNEFHKELVERTGLSSPVVDDKHAEEQFEWWRDQGFDVTSWADIGRNTPQEEWQCDDCAGTGMYQHEISLVEALQNLGVVPADNTSEEAKDDESDMG